MTSRTIDIGIVKKNNHPKAAQAQLPSWQGIPEINSEAQPPIMAIMIGLKPNNTIIINPNGKRI